MRDQIYIAQAPSVRAVRPKRVLVIGASTGYGLAARITAAFGFGAATLGVFLEKTGKENKPASAGWYNSAAFHKFTAAHGLPRWSVNGDAFSQAAREAAVDLIRREMGGSVDLVIYSLASPVRRLPDGATRHTAIKPIGVAYAGKSIDTEHGRLIEVNIPPASEQEIRDTVAVMGGENWVLWIDSLQTAGVLAENARTVAYSYIGPEITWPIYWHGTLGRAKQHLEDTAIELRRRYAKQGLGARVAMMKSIVTQASAAIPVMPLYVSVVFRVMKDLGLHEGAIEQQVRLFRDYLYAKDHGSTSFDTDGRLRLDERELCADVQQACKQLWSRLTSENLLQLTDYAGYQREFLRLFGFGRGDVDYATAVQPLVDFDCLKL